MLVDVGDAADDVLAEADLRIHRPRLRESHTRLQVHQVGCNLGGTDVDCQPKKRRALRKKGDGLSPADGKTGFPSFGPQLIGEPPKQRQIKLYGLVALSDEGIIHPPGVRTKIGKCGSVDLEINGLDNRISGDDFPLPLQLKPLGRGEGFRRDLDLQIAERHDLAGQTVALCQVALAQLGLFGKRDRREFAAQRPHPAPCAGTDASAN